MKIDESILVTHIRETGPDISAQDIQLFEKELGGTLPAVYSDFLLRFNGGVYDDDSLGYPVADLPFGDWIGFFVFFGLNLDEEECGSDLREMWICHQGRIPDRMVPIADSAEDLILLDIQNGSIYYWERDGELKVPIEKNVFLIASSFTEFARGCKLIPREDDDYTIEDSEPFISIELRRLATLIEYLDDGFPIYSTNSYGQTLLYVACRGLDIDGAKVLLARGADPDDGDHETGRPPLWAAAGGGSDDMVRLLFAYGASPMMGQDHNIPIIDNLHPFPACKHMRSLFAEHTSTDS